MKTKFLIPLIAGIGLFCACKGHGGGGYEVVNNSPGSAAAESVKADSSAINKPKLVKTAGIHFKVKNVRQTAEHISALATGINGMVVHH